MKCIFYSSLFVLGISISGYAKIDSVRIAGHIDHLNEGDHVVLLVHKYGPFSIKPFVTKYLVKSINHSFKFVIPVLSNQESIDIEMPMGGMSYYNYFIAGTDNITLFEKRGVAIFKGEGALKYNVQHHLQCIYKFYAESSGFTYSFDSEREFEVFLCILDLVKINSIDYLKTLKGQLSIKDYLLLRSEVLLLNEVMKNNKLGLLVACPDSIRRKVLTVINKYKSNSEQLGVSYAFSENKVIRESPFYLKYILSSYEIDSCISVNKSFSIKKCYLYIREHFSGVLRERLITQFVYENKLRASEDLPFIINDAVGYLRHQDYKSVLIKLKKSYLVGVKAYDFSLHDINGIEKHLSDFKGKVVLIDFWFTGCGACRQVHPILDSLKRKYDGRPFELISVCVDFKNDSWQKSVRTGTYTSLQNVNLFAGGLSKNSPVIKYYDLTSYPTLLLIDKNGKMCNPPIDPRLDNARELVKQIDVALIK